MPTPRETPTQTERLKIIRVAIYLRQSYDGALSKSSVRGQPARIDEKETAIRQAVQRQLAACRKWIETRTTPSVRYEVVEVYEDNDTSASKVRVVRKHWLRMLADARAGEFELILAYHLDRLTRSIRDLLPLLELATAKTGRVGTTTASGDLDLTTDMGRMVAGILAVVAQAEVERKGARQVLANSARAEAGKPSQGGRRAFGYRTDGVTVIASEAKQVRKAYKAVLGGKTSLSQIARDLNAAGACTPSGNPWVHNSVRRLLLNPRYAGIRLYNGAEMDNCAWKPLVDEQTYRAAAAILGEPSRRTNHAGGQRRRLMTGLGRCGVCGDGTTVMGGSGGAGEPLYQCRNGKHLLRALDPIDFFVRRAVLARLSEPDALDLLIDPDAPDADALIGERLTLVSRQDALAAEYADPASSLTPAQMRIATQRFSARIADIDAQLADASRERVLGDLVRAEDIGAAWDALSLARRQAALDLLATWTIGKGKVGGNPATRYQTPEDYRVEIGWKV